MEPFYYHKMTKQQQAAYHVIMQGANALADEFQIPRIESAELYDVFFRLRLDHPEIFWMTGFKYKYYQDSPNLIFVPEYLFDKINPGAPEGNDCPGRETGKSGKGFVRMGKGEIYS